MKAFAQFVHHIRVAILGKDIKVLAIGKNTEKHNIGEVAEWLIAAVLKTVLPKGNGGSNPSLSAKKLLWKILIKKNL
jgi:hypothetical protein